MATDPHFDKVVLRLPLDSAQPEGQLHDYSNSAHVMTANGANVSVAGKFNEGRGRVGGALASHISTPRSPDFAFAGDFTIECWYQIPTAGAVTAGILGYGTNSGSGQRSWRLRFDGTSFIFNVGSGSELTLSAAVSPSTDYRLLCVERSGTVTRLYVDGVMLASTTSIVGAFNNPTTAGTMDVGGFWGSFAIDGAKVDDVRITNGLARYASDSGYPVPTEAFPISGTPPAIRKSLLIAQGEYGTASAGTRYIHPGGGFSTSTTTSDLLQEPQHRLVIRRPGILRNLRVLVGQNDSSTASFVEISSGSFLTALQLTIPPLATGWFSLTGVNVAVTNGDAICIRFRKASASTPSATYLRSVQMEYECDDGLARQCYSYTQRPSVSFNTAAARHAPITGFMDAAADLWRTSATDPANECTMYSTGDFTDAKVRIQTNSLNAPILYELLKNGSPSGLSITVPAATTGNFYSTGTTTVAPGDVFQWRRTATGATSGSAVNIHIDLFFRSATGGFDLFSNVSMTADPVGPGGGIPQITGLGGWTRTKDAANVRGETIVPDDYVVSHLRGRFYNSFGSGSEPAYAVVDGVRTTLEVPIPNFSTGSDPWRVNTTDSVSVAASGALTTGYTPPSGGTLPTYRAPFNIALTLTPGATPPEDDVDVPAGGLVITGVAPTLRFGQEVSVPAGGLLVGGNIPVLEEKNEVDPGTGELIIDGNVPLIEAEVVLDVLAGELKIASAGPKVFVGLVVTPPAGEVVFDGGYPVLAETMGAFSSQSALLVRGRGAVLETRVSQAAAIIIAEPPAPPVLSSQIAAITLGEVVPDVQASQAAIIVLAHADPCVTRRADFWLITRTDGKVFAYTSHDESVMFRGILYKACKSLDPTASDQSSALGGTGNMELSGLISDEGITEADLYGGLFDDAFVEVWRGPWDPSVVDIPMRLAAGWCGSLTNGDNSFNMEVLGPGTKLSQHALVQTVTPGCRWVFGDPETCGVDAEALGVASSVVAMTNRARFRIGASDPGTAPQWANGTLRWTTGRNAGISCEVKEVDWDTGQITLWAPPPFLPELGDALFLTPGCDKTEETCKAYANFLNFGGFPDLPGTDAIAETPDAKY